MSDWNTLQKRNEDNMANLMSKLSPEEQSILGQVIDFELQNRHIISPAYKTELKRVVEQVVRLRGDS